MKYVLLIMDTANEPAADSAEYGAWYTEIGAWYEKWGATGKLEKEVLGGYSVLAADSVDEAVSIAKTWPGVDRGWITVEVRPVIEMG